MRKANKGLPMQAVSKLVERWQRTGGALIGALSLFALLAHADARPSLQTNLAIQAKAKMQASSDIQASYDIVALDSEGTVVHAQQINVQRSENRVYRAYPQRGVAEMWQRSRRGAVQYQRIYFPQQLIIDYGEAEAALLGRAASFPQGLQVVDRQLKPGWQKLPSCGEKVSAEGRASCFGADKVELYWLSEQAMPLSASWLRGEHRYQLRLLSLKPVSPALLQAQLEAFEHIDFADIGDNEAHSGLSTINSGQFKGAGYSQTHRH